MFSDLILIFPFVYYAKLQLGKFVRVFMKYLEFLWAMDFLYRYYPKYHSNELLLLADDILKWINNELPEDSSTLIYLKSCFDSPYEAISTVWKEVLLLSGPFSRMN